MVENTIRLFTKVLVTVFEQSKVIFKELLTGTHNNAVIAYKNIF